MTSMHSVKNQVVSLGDEFKIIKMDKITLEAMKDNLRQSVNVLPEMKLTPIDEIVKRNRTN